MVNKTDSLKKERKAAQIFTEEKNCLANFKANIQSFLKYSAFRIFLVFFIEHLVCMCA